MNGQIMALTLLKEWSLPSTLLHMLPLFSGRGPAKILKRSCEISCISEINTLSADSCFLCFLFNVSLGSHVDMYCVPFLE